MKRKLRTLSILLLLLGCLLMAGCGEKKADSIRIGALKGPTTIGLAKLLSDQEEGMGDTAYTFTMATGADELIPLLSKAQLDIALVPANVAATVYQKLEGAVAVIDINTLGVLYVVSADTTISTVEDLAGKTICLMGKGTTPDLAMQYLLSSHGITDATLEYKSEATEVAAAISADESLVGVLPEPFVTAAKMNNEALQVVLSVGEQWLACAGEGHDMVTGVTIVRKAFLEEYPDSVKAFLADHERSALYVKEHPEEMAQTVVQYGIVGKEAIAKKAIPGCNITCIYGEAMKIALSDYLSILYEMDPKAVGGALPGEDFYFVE